MKKQNTIRYRSLMDGTKPGEWQVANSLDEFSIYNYYIVELTHGNNYAGLPIEHCSDEEHYIIAHLLVTDRGTTGRRQQQRVIGQTLVLSNCETVAMNIFTRTLSVGGQNANWSSWEQVIISGKNETPSNFDEVIATLTTLIADLKAESARAQAVEDNIIRELIGFTYLSDVLTQNGYYSGKDKNIGDTFDGVLTASSIRKSGVIDVKKDTVLHLYTYSSSGIAGYVRSLIITNNNGVITYISPATDSSGVTFDYASIPLEVKVPDDGKAYFECNTDKIDIFSVKCIGRVSILDENIIKLADEIKHKLPTKYNSEALTLNGYYKWAGLTIGDKVPDVLSITQTAQHSGVMHVSARCSIIIKTYSTSNMAGYRRPWVLADNEQIIQQMPDSATKYDLLENGANIYVEREGYLYFSCDDEFLTNFSIEIIDGELGKLVHEIDNLKQKDSGGIKTTNTSSFYLPNRKVLLSGASISQYNGYFEYVMQKLSLTGVNISVAGHNIFSLCNKLYNNGSNYNDIDLLIISHVHNYDVYTLPIKLGNYMPADYENDSLLSEYITTTNHVSGVVTPAGEYTVDEMYAIGYDYTIKKWAELCYNLKNTDGLDALFGKHCQIILYTYWHDGRTTYNKAIRLLSHKWGLPLIKDDENIGFSKEQVHPITHKQQSVLYCNGTPWGSKTEVIDGITYGFHPSGISTTDWAAFLDSDADTKLSMLPYIQKKRAAILLNFIKDYI